MDAKRFGTFLDTAVQISMANAQVLSLRPAYKPTSMELTGMTGTDTATVLIMMFLQS